MRTPTLLSVVSCLVIFAGIATPTRAQSIEHENPEWVGGLTPVVATRVSTVDVDVFVRNKDGEPTTGLARENFRVFQDGVTMPITSFSAFTQESLIPSNPHFKSDVANEASIDTATVNAEEPHPIYLVLYIDNANIRRMDRNRVLRAMQPFAESILAGPVQIMVVSHGETIEIVQPFTDNPREVVRALRYIRTLETLQEDYDDRHTKIQGEIRRTIKNRNKSSAGREQVLSNLYDEIRVFADEEVRRLAEILQSIHEVGATLTGVNGRKYLVYISNGLPLVVSKDLLHEFVALYNQTSTLSLSIPYNKKRHYDALAAAANAQAITVHAVDATGPFSASASIGDSESPRSSSAATVAHENRQMPLRMLTENTGGLAVLNTDDFFTGFDRIKADLLTYYSISYEIETSASDRIHLIDIKLNDTDAKKLRFRKAFVEKSFQSQVQEKVNASLFFEIDENPMNLEITTGEQKNATTEHWMMPVKISFPISSLALAAEGDDYIGTAVVFVATRDFEGRRTDIQRRSHEVKIPAQDYQQRKDTRFIINLNLLLESGGHTIVVGLLDEKTRRASYSKIQTTIDDDRDED